ncbi:MAG: glycosyltransferase family 4 protein [Pseudomonadota bacterium]|nr:glycosyltransferase family 4 protein [Pseudomonadota bacterium]
MTGLLPAAAFTVTAVFGGLLTGFLARSLRARALLDHPNARSLHDAPVPRGGGIAMAVLVLTVQGLLLVSGYLPRWEGGAWLLAGCCFALLGWWDDLRPRPAAQRVVAQFVIAIAFVAGACPEVLAAGSPPWNYAAAALLVVALVWVVNLFNFMDGADGYAGTQARLFGVAALALMLFAGAHAAAVMSAAVAGSSLGFLYWNRPVARIFMGDVGSYFIGFQLAAIAIAGYRADTVITVWLILLMPFLVDATFTLLRRILAREKWWAPHRSHAYQLLVLGGWTQARLLTALAALNVIVCWPLALWVFFTDGNGWLAALLAGGVAGMIWAGINFSYANLRSASK